MATVIPEQIRGYAEVVVTVADGLAHRPAWTQIVTGWQDRWDPDHYEMVRRPIYGLAWRPACAKDDASGTSQGPDAPRPRLFHLSAGWAHHIGHAGCPACWPGQE